MTQQQRTVAANQVEHLEIVAVLATMGRRQIGQASWMNDGLAPSRGRSDLPILISHAPLGRPLVRRVVTRIMQPIGLTPGNRPPPLAGVF